MGYHCLLILSLDEISYFLTFCLNKNLHLSVTLDQPCCIESSADSMKMTRKIDKRPLKKKWTHLLGWLIIGVGEEVETPELWCIAGGNVKCHCHHGRQFGNSSKVKQRIAARSTTSTSRYIHPKQRKAETQPDSCTPTAA